VALVTGGTRGIGAATCRSLADEGAHVAAGYWRNDDEEAVEKFLTEMTDKQWHNVIAVNLSGAFFMAQAGRVRSFAPAAACFRASPPPMRLPEVTGRPLP